MDNGKGLSCMGMDDGSNGLDKFDGGHLRG